MDERHKIFIAIGKLRGDLHSLTGNKHAANKREKGRC